MKYSWVHAHSQHQQEWLLKRNCSLAPRQLAGLFCSLAVLSLAIGVAFALLGAWLVVPFACIEVLALGAAFLVYARHASDYERIVLSDECLVVETRQAERVRRERYDRAWIRVVYTGARRELIRLVIAGAQVEIGRHVPESERPRLASELRAQLNGTGT